MSEQDRVRGEIRRLTELMSGVTAAIHQSTRTVSDLDGESRRAQGHERDRLVQRIDAERRSIQNREREVDRLRAEIRGRERELSTLGR